VQCSGGERFQNYYWKRTRNKNSLNFTKSETVVKINHKCACKGFYTFVLNEEKCPWNGKVKRKACFQIQVINQI
jgi:hypothetical protein